MKSSIRAYACVYLLATALAAVLAAEESEQSKKRPYATVEAALVHGQTKEELLRGTVATGFIPGATLCVGNETRLFDFSFHMEMTTGTTLILDAVPVNSYGASLRFDALRRFLPQRDRIPAIAAGLSLDAGADVEYCERLQGMHFLWLTRYGVEGMGRLSWEIREGWNISIEGRALICSLVSRPPERFTVLETTGLDPALTVRKLHEDMFASPPWETGRWSFRAEAWTPEWKGFRETFAYEYSYAFSSEPRPVTIVTNGLRVGLKYSFPTGGNGK